MLVSTKKTALRRFKWFGGDDEARTHYLYNANVALSQMSYAPGRIDYYSWLTGQCQSPYVATIGQIAGLSSPNRQLSFLGCQLDDI